MKKCLVLALLLAAAPLFALEFESGGESAGGSKSAPKSAAQDSSLPRLIDVGDIPTGYGLLKYEMRADIRFYPGGGLLNKVYLGIFPLLSIGGALNVPGIVAAGPVTLAREDAALLVKFSALPESDNAPAISLGWDGPAFGGAPQRGLYAAASKDIRMPLGYFQAHAGVNNGYFLNDWVASRYVRGFGGLSLSIRQVTLFFEADEIGHPVAPRLDGGARVFFDPISLGLEFRDVGALRPGVESSRMLRVSYSGMF